MISYAGGNKINLHTEKPLPGQTVICVAPYSEMSDCFNSVGINITEDPINDLNASTHFESHTEYEFFCINKPAVLLENKNSFPVSIFFTAKSVFIFTDNEEYLSNAENTLAQHAASLSANMLLYYFFNYNFNGDTQRLEHIEDILANLENGILDNQYDSVSAELLLIRKDLLEINRYYEALFDLLQDLEENLNNFICEKQLRRFRIQTNRADRFSNMVVHLREYAVQVREAYQNQIDLNLNGTMKLFTVITAIFLPLTLIVGWFGMNLQMPEFAWEHTYPVVIFISIAIVVVLLGIFKKKKWF